MVKAKVKRNYDDYIFIRLRSGDKDKAKEKAASEGMDMTTWIRNLVIRNLKK